MIVVLFLLGVVCGATAIYIILNPKVKTTKALDLETEEKNNKLRTDMLYLEEQCANYTNKKEQLCENIKQLKEHIADIQKQAEDSANTIYEKSFELANERMSAAAERMASEYQEAKKQAEQEYIELMAFQSANLMKELKDTNIEIETVKAQLADLSAKALAAVEAAKRQEEMEKAQDFYKLNLPDEDIEEIAKLRKVTVLLRNSEPLNKVIWKVYYEKPYTDLIGRVIGNGVRSGIYKITNIENQKCYVGQAVDLAARWKTHIKRGVGAETPTRNKLYPAMLEIGVENFTFEVIEECPRAQLDEREDYWQAYFQAKEFGYSIK